jgi:hypothetical protein
VFACFPAVGWLVQQSLSGGSSSRSSSSSMVRGTYRPHSLSERRWLTGNTPADAFGNHSWHARCTAMQAARVCLSAAAGWGAHVWVTGPATEAGAQSSKGRAHPAMRGVCACWGCPFAAGVLA